MVGDELDLKCQKRLRGGSDDNYFMHPNAAHRPALAIGEKRTHLPARARVKLAKLTRKMHL